MSPNPPTTTTRKTLLLGTYNLSVLVSVIIPVRNEAENIHQLAAELGELALGHREYSFEVIFVDDASTDPTPEQLASLLRAETNFELRVIRLDRRVGQAIALRAGFEAARSDILIRMDGDCQDDPRDISKFLQAVRDGSDLVVGLREVRSHSRILRFASQQFDAWSTLLLDSPFHSSVASFACFRKRLLRGIRWGKRTNRFLVLELLRNSPAKPSEIFVSHRPRTRGISNYPVAGKIISGSLSAAGYLAIGFIRKVAKSK